MLLLIAPELCEVVIMHLPPRHVYKLMQTNKHLSLCCCSEAYWIRVAVMVVWSDVWCECFMRPHGWEEDYHATKDMVLLKKSYRDTMDDFIQGVRNELCTPPDGERRLLDNAYWALEDGTVQCQRDYLRDFYHDERPEDMSLQNIVLFFQELGRGAGTAGEMAF